MSLSSPTRHTSSCICDEADGLESAAGVGAYLAGVPPTLPVIGSPPERFTKQK